MESLFMTLIVVVNVAAPVLLLAAGVVLYFVVQRMRRERAGQRAAAGNAVAMEMEKMRQQASLLLSLAAISVLLGLGLSSFIAGEGGGITQALIMAVGVVVGLVFLVKWLNVRSRINTLFKEHVVTVELGKVFSKLHYAPDESMSREELAGLDFFSCLDVVSGGDRLVAEYNGLPFTQCNLLVQETYTETRNEGEGSSTETCTRDVFRGRVMRLDVDTTFQGVVQIIGKQFSKAKVTSQKDWSKVATDFVDFNNAFTVYAKNNQDVIDILTQKMMNGILRLSSSTKSPVSVCCKDKSMYVFLSTPHKIFSVSGGKTLQEEEALLQHDIQHITEFLTAMGCENQR